MAKRRRAIPKQKKRERFTKEPPPGNVIAGERLNYNASIAVRYNRDVNKLIDEMTTETEKELAKLYTSGESQEYFEDPVALDAGISDDARKVTNRLMREFEKIFKIKGLEIATRMAKETDKSTSAAVNTSLRALSENITIEAGKTMSSNVRQISKASINANVKLITSIQEQYFQQIVGAVDRSIMTGGGLQELIPAINDALKGQKRIAKNRAKNIALDQTRKAYNSMNKAKMEDVGVKKFEWVHAGGGQKPRSYHMNRWPAGLNSGIFSFDDLPVIDEKTGERGIPGQAINCKCIMRPVIEFDEG